MQTLNSVVDHGMGGEDTAATAGSISAGVLKSQSGDRSHVTVLFGDQEYV